MNFRRILLHVMLWSLGIAAAIGALAVLFFRDEMIWRTVASAIDTAAASAVMLGFSALIAREKWKKAAILGMGFIVIEFLLVLALIWIVDHGLHNEEELLLTILSLFITALPAVFMLRMFETPMMRVSGIAGAAIAAMVFVLLAGSIWIQDPWSYQRSLPDCLAQTAGMLALFGMMAVASLVNAGQDRRDWRYLGALFAIIGLGVAMWCTWSVRMVYFFEPVVVLAAITGFFAVANPVALCPLRENQQWLRYGMVIGAAAAAAAISASVSTGGATQELLARLAGAIVIIIACGCMSLVVLALLNRRVDIHQVAAEIREYTIVCPGCGQKQTLAAGDASCGNCGLKIHTRFEEPRCATCGYLLYHLRSDRCPECGTPTVPLAPMPATPING